MLQQIHEKIEIITLITTIKFSGGDINVHGNTSKTDVAVVLERMVESLEGKAMVRDWNKLTGEKKNFSR